MLYDLCASLVRERVATVEDWKAAKQKCLPFAQGAILRMIGEDRWNLIRRNVEYHLAIADRVGGDYYGEIVTDGRLALTIECSGCGYVNIGRALEAMEADCPGLGGAFYWQLIHITYRVMRIYDHDDALRYEESLREMAEGEEDPDQHYEFPDVEKSLPECVRTYLHGDHPRHASVVRQKLATARHGRFSAWLDRLRRMERLARLHVGVQREHAYTYNFDSAPLPSLLIAFGDRDPITACFDEEGQHMLEGSCEPALLVTFDPKKESEVRLALRSATRFILFNEELFALVEDIARLDKAHEHSSLDRPEPSLRAS